MKKTLISLAILTVLSGCAVMQSTGHLDKDPEITSQMKNVKKEFDTIPSPAAGKPVSVAVYSFTDKTGQRRPQANVASLSTAVTQGAESFLISALQNVGKGQWFEVVERVGIDNLTKERLIIRQMREAYEGTNAKPLMPMQFAGIIIEGGIVGYDTSTTSGGAGMRIFGIGKQTQWSTDTVTVSLRAVSVNTGKVLMTVTVQKTILSTGDSVTALKFFDNATQSFEAEAGLTINEPGTYAVKAATEMAVVELIKEGQRKGVWDYRQEPVAAQLIPQGPAPLVIEPKSSPVISSEIKQEAKVEEKKDVVVQPQTPSETKPEAVPSTATEVKKEPVVLFGRRQVKENAFLHIDQDEKSTRKWWIAKGTEISVLQPGSEGWVRVKTEDGTNRGGWIRLEKLEEVKQ
jgi:curli production assembly/transport component CsgG